MKEKDERKSGETVLKKKREKIGWVEKKNKILLFSLVSLSLSNIALIIFREPLNYIQL